MNEFFKGLGWLPIEKAELRCRVYHTYFKLQVWPRKIGCRKLDIKLMYICYFYALISKELRVRYNQVEIKA